MVRTKQAVTQMAMDFDVKPALEQLWSPDEIFERAGESVLRKLSEDRRSRAQIDEDLGSLARRQRLYVGEHRPGRRLDRVWHSE